MQNSIRSVYTATSSTVDLLLYYSLILDSCARNCSRAQSEKTEKRKREREGERGRERELARGSLKVQSREHSFSEYNV